MLNPKTYSPSKRKNETDNEKPKRTKTVSEIKIEKPKKIEINSLEQEYSQTRCNFFNIIGSQLNEYKENISNVTYDAKGNNTFLNKFEEWYASCTTGSQKTRGLYFCYMDFQSYVKTAALINTSGWMQLIPYLYKTLKLTADMLNTWQWTEIKNWEISLRTQAESDEKDAIIKQQLEDIKQLGVVLSKKDESHQLEIDNLKKDLQLAPIDNTLINTLQQQILSMQRQIEALTQQQIIKTSEITNASIRQINELYEKDNFTDSMKISLDLYHTTKEDPQNQILNKKYIQLYYRSYMADMMLKSNLIIDYKNLYQTIIKNKASNINTDENVVKLCNLFNTILLNEPSIEDMHTTAHTYASYFNVEVVPDSNSKQFERFYVTLCTAKTVEEIKTLINNAENNINNGNHRGMRK